MKKKIDENTLKEYVGRVEKGVLVEWLVGRCRDDDGLRASLLDLVVPKEGVDDMVREIRSRITAAWARTGGRDGYRMAVHVGRELDSILGSIGSMIEKGNCVEAEKVLVRFVEAAEKFSLRMDDSSGFLWPVCQMGVSLWGKAWAGIEPRDRIGLAEVVYAHVHNNTNGLKDKIVIDFKDALGSDGLWHLKEKLLNDYRQLPDSKKYTLGWQLKHIADVQGDVDFFIEINRMQGPISRSAIPIARRLYEAGRYEEAFEYLEKAESVYFSGEAYDYATLKSKILVALGRSDEALRVLWGNFAGNLSDVTLESILELTDNTQHEQVRQKAYQIAIDSGDIYGAMSFLARQGQLAAAANLIEQRQDEIAGHAYGCLLRVAEQIEKPFPRQTWILYKALAMTILDASRYDAYGHAAKYVKIMGELAKVAGIEGRHDEFLDCLKLKHKHKRSFWGKVNS